MSEKREKRQVRSIPSEFKTREEDGKMFVSGYFAVFDSKYEIWDGWTESVDKDAFGDLNGKDVRALANHDTRIVLGRTKSGTLSLRVDGHGLWGDVEINPEDTDAMNLYARVKRGDVNQCSFGFDILQEDYEDNGETVHWTIKSVELYEVSVVTFPAYEETGVVARSKDVQEIKKRKNEVWKNEMQKRLKGG